VLSSPSFCRSIFSHHSTSRSNKAPHHSFGTLVLNTQSSPAVFFSSLPPSSSLSSFRPSSAVPPGVHNPPLFSFPYLLSFSTTLDRAGNAPGPKVNLSRRLAQPIRVLDAVQFPSHNEFLPVKRALASSSQKPRYTALLNHAQEAPRAHNALMKSHGHFRARYC
jgi:hypothetical protein